MVFVILAGLVGGIAAGDLFLSNGILPALFVSSMVGSGCAAFAAIILMARRGQGWATHAGLREPTEEMAA